MQLVSDYVQGSTSDRQVGQVHVMQLGHLCGGREGDSGVMRRERCIGFPHGFVTVRGRERGYRPEQVEAYAAALSEERDGLGAGRPARAGQGDGGGPGDLEEVARPSPRRDYEVLGRSARDLFRLGEEGGRGAVRGGGRAVPRRGWWQDAAGVRAAGVREAARARTRRPGRTRRRADERA